MLRRNLDYVLAARRQPSNTVRSRHGDADDLAGSRRCGAEVRDVEVAVRAEGHAGRDGESSCHILDFSLGVEADDFSYARRGIACGGRKLKRIEQAIGRETDGDDSRESSARADYVELAPIPIAGEARNIDAGGALS
jgi:hypothetical protein